MIYANISVAAQRAKRLAQSIIRFGQKIVVRIFSATMNAGTLSASTNIRVSLKWLKIPNHIN
jgi:hypothetical protein